jgi:PhnB protein
MKVMVFVKATKDSEAGVPPDPKMLEAMGKYNEALIAAGILKEQILGGLKPTRFAKRVHFSGKNRTVIDGPFVETKELVAGFWLWEVKSIDEAVEWVKKCPNPMLTDSDVEIRPLYSLEDITRWKTSSDD